MTEGTKLIRSNFSLQWNPQTDESYIKMTGIESMDRDNAIRQILADQDSAEILAEIEEFVDKYPRTLTIRGFKEILKGRSNPNGAYAAEEIK